MRKQTKTESLSLTTNALAENVAKKTNLELERVKETINEFFSLAKQQVLDTGSFKLQNLGTFTRMFVEERERRNPQTGETIVTPANYKVKFVPVASLAKRINKPYEHLKPEVIEDALAENVNDENFVEPEIAKFPNDEKSFNENVVNENKNVSYENFSNDFSTTTIDENVDLQNANKAQEQLLSDDDFSLPKDDLPPFSENDFPFTDDFSISKKNTSNEVLQNDKVHSFDKNGNEIPNANSNTVIEKQIIQQQIIQQQVVHAPKADETNAYNFNDDEDYEMDVEKTIRRWWFFAGISALAALIMVSLVAFTIFTNANARDVSIDLNAIDGKTTVIKAHNANSKNDAGLAIATRDNVYAALSLQEYGEANLWPYIFSANMLRFPDPDKPGLSHEIIIPPKPDKALDKKDIELSVIDVYDSYRALIEKENRKKLNAIRAEHSVLALLCGESLYKGFIDKYAVRLETRDIKEARRLLDEAKKTQLPFTFENYN